MNLSVITTHGVRGEWLTDDDGEIMLYLDDVFEGRFVPFEDGYRFHPITASRLTLTALNRITHALEKVNKERLRG